MSPSAEIQGWASTVVREWERSFIRHTETLICPEHGVFAVVTIQDYQVVRVPVEGLTELVADMNKASETAMTEHWAAFHCAGLIEST